MKISYEHAKYSGLLPQAKPPKLSLLQRIKIISKGGSILQYINDHIQSEQDSIDSKYIVDKKLILVEYDEKTNRLIELSS